MYADDSEGNTKIVSGSGKQAGTECQSSAWSVERWMDFVGMVCIQ